MTARAIPVLFAPRQPGPTDLYTLEELQLENRQRMAGYKIAMKEACAETLELLKPQAVAFVAAATDIADTLETVEREQATSFVVDFVPSRSLAALRSVAAVVANRIKTTRATSGFAPATLADFCLIFSNEPKQTGNRNS